MYSKKVKNLLLIIVSLFTVFVLNGCTGKAPEGVIAVVNKEHITIEEYQESYDLQSNVIKIRLGAEVLDQVGPEGISIKDNLKEEVLTRLILEKIIMQDANKQDIEVMDSEIDNRIEKMKQSMGGEEQLDRYKEALGMNDGYLRKFIETDIILLKHKEEYIENHELKEKNIKQFFEENKERLTLVKARQILVETEEEGKEVLKKIKNGEDFQKLAIAYSKDTDSVINAGELGFFQRGKYPSKFDEVVFALKKDEISDLIETELGYHIVELQERKDEFDDLKTEVTALAKETDYNDYIEKLQRKSKVKSYLEEAEK